MQSFWILKPQGPTTPFSTFCLPCPPLPSSAFYTCHEISRSPRSCRLRPFCFCLHDQLREQVRVQYVGLSLLQDVQVFTLLSSLTNISCLARCGQGTLWPA